MLEIGDFVKVNLNEVIQDALRHQNEGLSLAKAAEIAGASWAQIRRCLLPGLFLLVSCKVSEPAVQPTPVPEIAVNELGQYLASWANMHCTNIAIENVPILIEDGNAGGCSQLWWQHPEGLAFEERGDDMPAAIRLGAEQWHKRNESVLTLLTDRLNASDCNLDQLLQEAARFSMQTSEDEVAGHLSCLGEISFVPVEVGIE